MLLPKIAGVTYVLQELNSNRNSKQEWRAVIFVFIYLFIKEINQTTQKIFLYSFGKILVVFVRDIGLFKF